MRQIQEPMTQGHADEQSPDCAVTQMSEDAEAVGAHAPTQKSQASDAAQRPSTASLFWATSRSSCLSPSAKCCSVVLQYPGPQGRTVRGSLITRCGLFRGALKVLLTTRPAGRWKPRPTSRLQGGLVR
ncbi:hypothetical protein I79_009280 [Cricetulus griseus]|uniref:Uncharacterized protein n=1 Tax=Cricetulus griseus TaxID=10029 RepID=G3HFC4_CRIGR|nr:hypothetical protein I79_009280 [Cricetulus griseus]